MNPSLRVGSEHLRILGEYANQGFVRGSCIRFDVDEKVQRVLARVDPTVTLAHMIPERIQVERLQRLARFEILFVVTDEQRSSNQIDVDFDTDEPER